MRELVNWHISGVKILNLDSPYSLYLHSKQERQKEEDYQNKFGKTCGAIKLSFHDSEASAGVRNVDYIFDYGIDQDFFDRYYNHNARMNAHSWYLTQVRLDDEVIKFTDDVKPIYNEWYLYPFHDYNKKSEE